MLNPSETFMVPFFQESKMSHYCINYLLTSFILNTLKHIIFNNMRKAYRTNQSCNTSSYIQHVFVVNKLIQM